MTGLNWTIYLYNKYLNLKSKVSSAEIKIIYGSSTVAAPAMLYRPLGHLSCEFTISKYYVIATIGDNGAALFELKISISLYWLRLIVIVELQGIARAAGQYLVVGVGFLE